MDNNDVNPNKSQIQDTTESASLEEEGVQQIQKPIEQTNSLSRDKKRISPKTFIHKINIYFLGFIFLIVITAVISFVAFKDAKSTQGNTKITSTQLDQQALDKLKETDVKVGDPKQVLSVESNAVFAGKVLVKDSLEVAGQIKVGGPLNLPGISVSGTSSFDKVQINNLQIAGDTTIQGLLNVQKGATINGPLTVGGALSAASLNIQNISINGDITLNRHIDAGGGTPSRSNGSALGNGGTTSVSGTDTAGTVNINIGGNSTAGCFATINFNQRFNSPHIAITPVGSGGAGIPYYINRSSSNFSICTASAALPGSSFAFDYIVID
jgi:cytoskeletal protein CcmA (bactofilin family)